MESKGRDKSARALAHFVLDDRARNIVIFSGFLRVERTPRYRCVRGEAINGACIERENEKKIYASSTKRGRIGIVVNRAALQRMQKCKRERESERRGGGDRERRERLKKKEERIAGARVRKSFRAQNRVSQRVHYHRLRAR